MEIILVSIFSTIIVFMTIYSMIKALIIARKREEITFRKLIFFATFTIVTGVFIASILPFGYQKLFDAFGLLLCFY